MKPCSARSCHGPLSLDRNESAPCGCDDGVVSTLLATRHSCPGDGEYGRPGAARQEVRGVALGNDDGYSCRLTTGVSVHGSAPSCWANCTTYPASPVPNTFPPSISLR